MIRLQTSIIEKGGEFIHGFTYSGHPVSCAVAIANIKILAEDNVIDQRSKSIQHPIWQNDGKA